MKSKSLLVLLALFVLTVGADLRAEQLRYKFRDGAVYDNAMTMQMNMKMSVNGMDINIKVSQIADMQVKVTAVDSKGSADTEQRITRMRIAMEGAPGLGFEYDSASKEAPQGLAANLAPLFKALTEGTFKARLATSGAILKVEIPEGFADKLKASPQAAILGNLFTEEGLKDLVRSSAMTLPDGDSSVGDEWSNSVAVKMPFGGEQVTNTTYTYQGPTTVGDRSLEKIGLTSTLTIKADPNAQVPVTIKSHKGSGTILFDNRLGQMHKSTLAQTTVMQIEAGGQKIDQTIELKMTVTQKPGSAK